MPPSDVARVADPPRSALIESTEIETAIQRGDLVGVPIEGQCVDARAEQAASETSLLRLGPTRVIDRRRSITLVGPKRRSDVSEAACSARASTHCPSMGTPTRSPRCIAVSISVDSINADRGGSATRATSLGGTGAHRRVAATRLDDERLIRNPRSIAGTQSEPARIGSQRLTEGFE